MWEADILQTYSTFHQRRGNSRGAGTFFMFGCTLCGYYIFPCSLPIQWYSYSCVYACSLQFEPRLSPQSSLRTASKSSVISTGSSLPLAPFPFFLATCLGLDMSDMSVQGRSCFTNRSKVDPKSVQQPTKICPKFGPKSNQNRTKMGQKSIWEWFRVPSRAKWVR